MDVTDRIFDLLKKQGKTQKELAKHLATGTSTITGWKQNNRNPTISSIIPICEFFDVPPEYLLTGEKQYNRNFLQGDEFNHDLKEVIGIYGELDDKGKAFVREVLNYVKDKKNSPGVAETNTPDIAFLYHAEESGTGVRNIAIYDLPASAGTGLFLDSDEYTLMDFPEKAVPLQASFGVRISGDSMTPDFEDGDIVFVKQCPELNENEIGVFVINNEAYCKQYIRKKGKPYLESLNPEYPLISFNEFDNIRTVGKVIGKITP